MWLKGLRNVVGLCDIFVSMFCCRINWEFDRANPGQFWLLQIKGFRAKGPPSALPPAEKSSEAALGAAAVALATSRRILRSAPSGQSTGTFPSLSTVRGDRAGFQSAWRAQNDGRRGSAARRRRRDGTEKQSKKNPHRRPVSSQALRSLARQYLTSYRQYR